MFKQVLKTWLPLAAAITLTCFIIYGTVQQTYRSNANDPQIQIAEDAVHSLEHGMDAKELISARQVDMSSSLIPFTIIYDDHGNSVASDATLDGKIPSIPAGVLDFTRTHEQDVITWQPRSDVRNAMVIMHVQGSFNGFVAVGRSLRQVEVREAMLVKQILFGLIFSLIALLILVALLQVIWK